MPIKTFWNNLGITQKFSLTFYTILGLIGFLSVISYAMLYEVHRKTVSDIETSTDIQKLVLEMSHGLEKARRLKKEFSLKYAGLETFDPGDDFSRQIQEQLRHVSTTSDRLNRLIAASRVSRSLQENHVNLNLYVAMAKRGITTFAEMRDLVRILTEKDTGLQNQLARNSRQLATRIQLLGSRNMQMLFNRIQLNTRNYYLSRKRPDIQSAINACFFLREDINRSDQIPDEQKQAMMQLLTEYAEIANRIPALDTNIQSKSREFDLNAVTLEPVSADLILMAQQEVTTAHRKNRKITRTAQFLLIGTAVFGIILVSLLAYVIHSTITRKIVHLTGVATALQAGNLDVRGHVENKDELGRLAGGLNQMAIRLKELILGLEQQVEKRTQELLDTNQSLQKEITDRKLAEIEKNRLEAKLRQSQKVEAIGTMAGGIAHDFNNIIGIILGNAELAMEDIPEWNPVYVNLAEIKTAGLRAGEIVKQILSFSRKTEQRLKPMEFIPVLKDSLKMIRASIPTTIDIRQHLTAPAQTILGNPVQISQILLNLCINASHAMEETGGRIDMILENTVLDQTTVKPYPDLEPGSYLQLTVADNGPGISPRILNRIFDPYFTTKEVGKGSGMGLAVVLGIVKNHRGVISVDSEPEKGTRFSILFPLISDTPAIEEKAEENLFLGDETILFIDDEESITSLSRQMLERLGYHVETRLRPNEALDLFRSQADRFDLVITDMAMPQMSGVRLSEKIREIRPDIPIIICTGHSSLIDEEKARVMGIDAFVMKPITKQNIAETIRRVLDHTERVVI